MWSGRTTGCISSLLNPPAPQPLHRATLLTFLVETLGRGRPAEVAGRKPRGFRNPLFLSVCVCTEPRQMLPEPPGRGELAGLSRCCWGRVPSPPPPSSERQRFPGWLMRFSTSGFMTLKRVPKKNAAETQIAFETNGGFPSLPPPWAEQLKRSTVAAEMLSPREARHPGQVPRSLPRQHSWSVSQVKRGRSRRGSLEESQLL